MSNPHISKNNNDTSSSVKAMVILGLRKRRNAVANIKEIEELWKRNRSDSKDTFDNFMKEVKTTQ